MDPKIASTYSVGFLAKNGQLFSGLGSRAIFGYRMEASFSREPNQKSFKPECKNMAHHFATLVAFLGILSGIGRWLINDAKVKSPILDRDAFGG